MSDALQKIKGYLDSIRHNAANAALAKKVNEYGVCVKIVSDCEEAVLSLFRKLDREYWELLERFGQLQAKAERYEKALEEILNADCNLEGLDAERELDRVTDIALKALEGEE
jgi:hypothetical protein